MKHSAKHLFRSCLSMLLVLCMVCSLPLTALAADSTPKPGVSGVSDVNGDGIITYVSFGDSVTNGYGMEGYRFDDGTNVFGFRREPAASYPALIRDYLTEQGFNVNLEQMAISGFRMDELHWMLCDDYVADSYHNDFFATWNRTVVNRLMSKDADFKAQHGSAYDGTVDSANKIIMTEYRNAVKNADLITIDLGTNNFGTFVTNTVQEILGLKELKYEVDFSQYVDEKTAASLDAMLGQMVAGMLGASEGKSYDLAMTLARCLMYGYLGFTEHFDGAIEAIYEINPKAKVVVIDCYTMITGVELAGGALGENIDLDALYDMFIDLANFYSRELSPYANVVTHATLDSAPELFIDYYKDYPDASYPDSQYMHPSAERLMNEFVMENMGYDPDDPAKREEFNKNILAPIQLLDGYVNNLSATIKTDVIDKEITPQLNTIVGGLEDQIDTTITAIELIYTAVEGVATAKAMLPTAIEGVTAARTAVDASAEGVETAEAAVQSAADGVATAEAAVNTAIEGVATAESLVEIIVNDVVGNSMFSTSSGMKGIILSVIKSKVSEMDLSAYGFSNDEETVAMLSEEIYEVACLYVNEEKANGTAAAEKAITIEIMRFFLVEAKGYSEVEAQETAVLAYELNTIYKAEGKPAAVKAAIETEITDELMATLGTDSKTEAAEMVYYLGTTETEPAVKAAIEAQMTAEKLAELGLSDMTTEQAAALVYELGTLAGTDYKAAVIKAMTLKVDQATAELAYAMVEAYEAVPNDEAKAEEAAVLVAVAASLTDENMAALAAFGITDRTKAAEMVCQVALLYNTTYANTNSDRDAVVTCLVELAKTLGIEGIDKETASTGYDLYAGVYAPAIEAGKTEAEAKALTVVAAIKTQYSEPEGLAEAIYAVYKGTATKEQEHLAYYCLLVGAGIPENVAEAICTCYTNNLDGQYNNEYVKTTMIFFMTQALKMSAEDATDNYNSYLTYKNLPTTLSKIAKVDTIYFDALLSATAGGNLNLDAVAAEFMAGTLVLEKPTVTEKEDPAVWAEYKSDSALATLFFRFMSQDGIYTHPSEAGQQTLYKAARSVLNALLTAESDREIAVTSDSNVLVLGDFIAANAGSYVDALAGNVTNLSNSDFRLNEIRALLDSTYTRDEYAQSVLASVNGDDYVKAVQDSDVIILNVGSMNMGLIAKQLGTYMVDGSTYSMEFSDIGNMQTQNLGATMDAFLENFSGAFSTDAVGALMLSFETYGYGFTTFADCLDNTIETIQSLNPQADIVLVGMYDLMGDAYIHEPSSGMYLEMGHFIGHAVNLMNLHMSNYAAMTDNVTYVDVTATETNVPDAVNMIENGVEGIATAFDKAVPTADGYAYMAQILNCTIGAHIPADEYEIVWTWADDHSAASASFHCDLCGEQVTCEADVTCENTATCTESGKLTYTATVQVGAASYKNIVERDSAALGHDYNSVVTAPTCTEAGFTTYTCDACGDSYTGDPTNATGHSWSDPAWTWTETEEGFAASACFTCGNNCGTTETVPATMEVTDQKSTCTEAGKLTYTATVEFADETYTAVKTEDHDELAQHNFGEWTETKAPTCTEAGEEARVCTACDHTETRVTDPLGHRYGEDGKCHCGAVDPNAHPVCEYTVAETLTSGSTYILSLGGTQVGSYTFTQVEDGWTIQAADGSYLAIEDKALVNSASAFTWTYSNGSFSAVIETKSSNNWWSGIFGGWWGSGSNSSKETYYLVASGSGVGISTSASGSEAAFYTAHTDLAHSFGSGVVTAPTCTEDGYTTYTCDRCGYSYTSNPVSASGHGYTASVTAPTCTKDGYTTYTCDACGDSYTGDPTNATGHTMVDGVCTNCGHTEGSTEPPVVPEEGECTYLAEQSLTSGETYVLTLGGSNVGSYTFTQISGGWAIQTADGIYLALDNGALVHAADPFAWTYSNGRFSAESKSASSNNWWGNWWGSRSKTYYLVSAGSAVTVSTSTSNASAVFYQQVTGTHVYGDPVADNGSHVYTCVNCGSEKAVSCTDADCELCHPAVPEASIRVSVEVTSTSSGSSWWDRFFGSSKKTYTAAITVEAEGTEVKSVAYSTDDGSRWTEGTSFTSSSNITAFDIRVEATNGQTYYFTYSNGTVTEST